MNVTASALWDQRSDINCYDNYLSWIPFLYVSATSMGLMELCILCVHDVNACSFLTPKTDIYILFMGH